MSERTPPESDNVQQMHEQLEELLRQWSCEYDVSAATIVGVLQLKVMEVYDRQIRAFDDEDNDNDGDEWRDG